MALQNAFENLATETKQDAIITAIGGIGAAPSEASRIAEDSVTPGIYYVGKAAIGSGESSSVWKIKKLDTTAINLSVKWADGGNYSLSWLARESHTYV